MGSSILKSPPPLSIVLTSQGTGHYRPIGGFFREYGHT